MSKWLCGAAVIWATMLSVAHGEIIDRIAATIGMQVITDAQVIQEARVTAFIDGAKLQLDAASKRKVLDRMIDQYLMRREIASMRLPAPKPEEIAALLKQVKEVYPSESAYRTALANYGITEQDLVDRLEWQLATLRFIDFRFQPSVQITNAQVRQEYRKQTADWSSTHDGPVPSQAALQSQLEQIIRERLVDAALDRWLGEVRTQNDIIYHGEYKL